MFVLSGDINQRNIIRIKKRIELEDTNTSQNCILFYSRFAKNDQLVALIIVAFLVLYFPYIIIIYKFLEQ